MLGKFQQSNLRIEVEASQSLIGEYLIHPRKLREWMLIGQFSQGLPEKFVPGLSFTSNLGISKIGYKVEIANDHCLCFILSQGIDGYHEWLWGDGWVQSSLEGISLLPLNLAQTGTLLVFKEFLQNKSSEKK